jgi:hypothetical protein
MSLVAEYTVCLPEYAAVLEELPGMRLVVEGMTACDPETVSVTFWAEGSDFETFEDGLERTAAIQDAKELSDRVDGRKLYQLRLPAAATTYWAWTGLGGVLLDCTLTHSGMWMRMRFPDRDALAAYHDDCETQDCTFELTGLKSTDNTENAHGALTTPQTELLTAAVESGYFDVPRRITMADLATEFDISNQAASERLRRGLSNALQNGAFNDPAVR